MAKSAVKKVQTDADVKKKAVKLVVVHLKKKLDTDYVGIEAAHEWIEAMEALFEQEEFDLKEYHRMRKELNDVIERTPEEEMRFKLRDSWYSMGKALDKKVKRM